MLFGFNDLFMSDDREYEINTLYDISEVFFSDMDHIRNYDKKILQYAEFE